MQRIAAKPVNILRTVTAQAVASGADATLQPRVACQGFAVVVGGIRATAATPATGYPRVVQYSDDGTVARIDVLAQDTGQPNYTYPINVSLTYPYVGIEWREAAGVGNTIEAANAELRGSQ